MPLFDALKPQSLDPIMAGFQEFAADRRPGKINLGIGMYYDEDGRIPILEVVRRAQQHIEGRIQSWDYLQPDGLPALRDAAKRLVFGEDGADRIVTVQSLGGTGALKLGADVIRRLDPDATVAMSDPTWGNHPAIFGGAGLRITRYPYFDPATGGVDWPAMREGVAGMAPGTVLLLHACCHNPTGADLPAAAWDELAGLIEDRQLVPFLDMAYAGFADGLEQDSFPARLLARRRLPVFVATSFSKSFALYGERVGALSIVAPEPSQAPMVLDQVKVAIRTNYSTPPTHGALLVSEVLGDAELSAAWRAELEGMRQRILRMRQGLVARLEGNNAQNFERLVHQRGLFSYSGLSAAQMTRLKEEFGIYGVSDGRLCMAALTERTLDRVAEGIRAVVA
ncbi:MAG: aspartate/tyrosine/aromatic aminotransferase [Acetobacteraceae bacterium]|nr:aspartate/tyrosine/aromatic aminotransferase [Acetobacteraceae bacterium]